MTFPASFTCNTLVSRCAESGGLHVVAPPPPNPRNPLPQDFRTHLHHHKRLYHRALSHDADQCPHRLHGRRHCSAKLYGRLADGDGDDARHALGRYIHQRTEDGLLAVDEPQHDAVGNGVNVCFAIAERVGVWVIFCVAVDERVHIRIGVHLLDTERVRDAVDDPVAVHVVVLDAICLVDGQPVAVTRAHSQPVVEPLVDSLPDSVELCELFADAVSVFYAVADALQHCDSEFDCVSLSQSLGDGQPDRVTVCVPHSDCRPHAIHDALDHQLRLGDVVAHALRV